MSENDENTLNTKCVKESSPPESKNIAEQECKKDSDLKNIKLDQKILDFEECAHKLMKMELKPGQEIELCHMFLDCCAEQRTYEKFYGLLSQRFCQINNVYVAPFEQIFKDTYYTTHRLDTNRLRNVSKFFAHLLFTDAISWQVLEIMKLNEEDTTSSSRIFIKILFQELSEYMGTQNLNARLKDPTLETYFAGLFPRDNPKNTRFAINFFTSIGLGGLTNSLREHLKMLPKLPTNEAEELSSSNESSSSSSSSSDSSSSSSESSDDSEEEKSKRNKKKRQIEKPVKGNRVDKEKITEELNVNHERMAKDRRRREEYPERQSRNRRDDVREPQNKKKEYNTYKKPRRSRSRSRERRYKDNERWKRSDRNSRRS
ncbi:hypothetical protein RN001_016466 [Aquatica leii]|uniref:MI domain-containing protein n=1 Tax=Aquatica leii TaxID=1421715 RepID=A0AAN7PXH9_9COLE|nr:hypothetical protein RN001_016466 [Aquatica leii]